MVVEIPSDILVISLYVSTILAILSVLAGYFVRKGNRLWPVVLGIVWVCGIFILQYLTGLSQPLFGQLIFWSMWIVSSLFGIAGLVFTRN